MTADNQKRRVEDSEGGGDGALGARRPRHHLAGNELPFGVGRERQQRVFDEHDQHLAPFAHPDQWAVAATE